MKLRILILTLLVSLTVVACERREREQAGVAAPENAVGEASELAYSTKVAPANVAAVLPAASRGPDGQAIYGKVCAACHQSNGQGVPGAFPPLDNSPYVTGPNVERLASIMIYGLMGPIHVNGTVYNSVMTPQGEILKDDELAAVASYIRGAWSNKASGIETTVFQKVREKYGKRGQFNIQELGEEK